MRARPLALAACALWVTALGAQSTQPASARLVDRLQAKFEELHKAASFPGGTAGFALADGSLFGIAIGVSDRAAKTPMQPTDRLLLGSVGKTYMPDYQTDVMYFPALKRPSPFR